jgi:putative two-component system response regulator
MTSVLVVDDQEQMRRALARIVGAEGYRCQQAGSVREARAVAERHDGRLDVVLCDIDMPGGSGLDLVPWLAANRPDTAVLMVTACDDPAVAAAVLEAGADGYIVKPFDPSQIVISLAEVVRRRERASQQGEAQRLLKALVERRNEQLDASYEETVWRLALAAEHRDPETADHLDRMARYSELLARSIGADGPWCDLLRSASPMHDVGKLGVPDEVLLNPGRFTAAERAVMQQHAAIGHQILDGSTSPLLQLAASVALTHHEWWDGTGYPRGLVGTAIPLEGRIVAIADVFDALTTERRYKAAMTFDEAEEVMRSEVGHFEPSLLDAFFAERSAIEAIQADFPQAAVAS